MAPFWTDTPIEDWPTTETRLIEMPDGEQRPVTANWLVWEYYDWMIRTRRITAERIVALAMQDDYKPPRTFEESFSAVCTGWGLMHIEVLEMFKPQIERRKAELRRQLRELSSRQG